MRAGGMRLRRRATTGETRAPVSAEPRALLEDITSGRDRYADLLRVGSILLVVLGHWLLAVILVRAGALVTGQLLAMVPRTRPLTWLFQVMPVFFLVGGFANLGSWERSRADGEPFAVWLRRRAGRLLGPLVPLLLLWAVLAVALGALGLPGDLVATVAETALLPAWFLVVYGGIIALVPVTAALHRRFGAGVLLVMLLLIAAIDVAHHRQVPGVGYANYLVAWAGIHQLGYFWDHPRLRRGPLMPLAVAAAGIVATGLLIRLAGYPVSMVGVPGLVRQNTSPPTVALVMFALGQIGLLLAARPAVERWLRRDRVYGVVARMGSVVLTVFLWHMTALIAVAALLHPIGFWPRFERVDGGWWALRPLWILLCALALIGLVALFRRFEMLDEPLPHHGRLRALAGLAAALIGLAMVMVDGIYRPYRTWKLPLGALGLLLLGLGSLGVLRRGRAAAAIGGGDAPASGGR